MPEISPEIIKEAEFEPRDLWKVVLDRTTFHFEYFLRNQKIDSYLSESPTPATWPKEATRATIEKEHVQVYENRSIRIPLKDDFEIVRAAVEVVNNQWVPRIAIGIRGAGTGPAEIEANFNFEENGLVLTDHDLHHTLQDSFKDRLKFLVPQFSLLAKKLDFPCSTSLESAFNCLPTLEKNAPPKIKFMLR